jgi:Domain of unknown function (DUF4388)
MALTGTLKDFGIAEILQLIGQQAKGGVLHLKSKSDEIHILWADGNVVSAEDAGRKAREKLGSLLVRAGLLSQEQLAVALETQRRTLRRLGALLTELHMVSKDDLREMTALQTTETVYRLFHWKSGTYAFEPGEVEYDRETVTPLRAESVLMEGFRQVDEWPMIRRKITSTAMTFERLREMEPETEPGSPTHSRTITLSGPLGEPPDDDVDAAFSALEGGDKPSKDYADSVGKNERRVFELAVPGRTVERIIDLSRLGEFETCKALVTLANLAYLRAVPPSRLSAAAEVGAYARDWQLRVRRGVSRLLATFAIAATLAGLAWYVNESGFAWADPAGGGRFRDNGAQRFIARYQMARLAGALEVYRLERGGYPEDLGVLVDAGLAERRDLRYPWTEPYYYRRKAEGGFVLLPPVE